MSNLEIWSMLLVAALVPIVMVVLAWRGKARRLESHRREGRDER